MYTRRQELSSHKTLYKVYLQLVFELLLCYYKLIRNECKITNSCDSEDAPTLNSEKVIWFDHWFMGQSTIWKVLKKPIEAANPRTH